MKWVNGSLDRDSFYYKINVEILEDRDYIQDVKNMLLEVQVDCKIKSKVFSGNFLKCYFIVLV